ncbi:MAG TPA: 4'-phosphopantetheinyl transferase superfamily protein [Candidatus Bathyarchaeia archaeon]|nr:4'-phosphopantetheinyl transferase superfamily protein [Candidatus Bathyarchaeia archaeon]
MIHVLGIDAVDISRFASWHTKPHTSLHRIFTAEEIAYALQDTKKSAERFAVRFAAKEAFLKGVQQLFVEKYFSLLKIARCCFVQKNSHGQPFLRVDWQQLIGHSSPDIFCTISLTHTHTTAIAVVMLSKNL